MPFSSAPERVSIRATVIAALTLIASLLAAGIARADITGSWSTSGSSGSAIVMGIEVTQSGVLDGSAYTNQSFNSGSYWSNPYGGAVSGGPGLWFTTPTDPNATRTVTVTFSKPIDNPVLHVNKMGGFARTNPNPAVSNTSVWTLVGSNSQGGSVNLSRLSGNPAFQVSGNSFQREPWVNNVQETADCRADNLGTGCGSVMFNGTGITSLTFHVASEGATFNGRLDGLSMRWSFAGSTVTVKKQSIGSTGSFAFQANQGIGAFNLDTTQANPATSSLYRVQDHSQPINIGETVPAGATVTASCVDGANRSVSSTLTGGNLSVAAPAYGGNQDLTCTFVNSKLPTIQISKVSQGGTGTFSFSGSNGVATHSIVTSAQGTAVAGPVQTLAVAGAATTISEAANPDYLPPSITCSGLASGGNYVVSGYAVEFDAAATAAGAAIACTYTNTRKSPSLAVTKTVDKASTGTLGETLNYTITVKNTGNVDQTGIRIADTLPDGTAATLSGPSGDSGVAGTLEVGETWTYTATYRVTQKDLDTGSNLVNRVSVTSDQVTSPASAQATTSVAQQAALRLTKTQTSGPNPVTAAGQVIGYTITLTNTGNVAQTGIDISDSLPDGAVVALAGPSGDGGVAGTLEVGETWTYAISYTVTQADLNTGKSLVNTAQATSRQVTTPVTGRATTPVDVSPALTLRKTAGAPSGSTAGSTISYSFALTNTGNVPLRNVSVAESLPGVVLSGNPVASLAVGESRTITGRYTLKQEDIERGFVVNSATASGRGPGNNPVESAQSSTETRLAQAPKLTLQKTAGAPSSDRAGGKITYSFTVKNEGNVTLSRIAIGDEQLDAPAVCQATTLAPGASTTCTGTHTLTQADINAGKVDNTARVSGQSGSTIVTSDPASASVSIAEKGALTLRKTAGAPSGNTVGSTITYSFTVKNEGNVTLSDVTLSDALAGVVVSGGPIASLAPGAVDSTTFTARYTLTQADIDAGKVDNSATASGRTPSGAGVKSAPSQTSTPLPRQAKLAIVKTAGPASGGKVGDTIAYGFRVENTGNVTLTEITIGDALAGINLAGGPIASLAPGAVDSTTFTATYTLTQADIDRGSVANSATAGGKDPGGAAVTSPPSRTTTPIAAAPQLSLSKRAGPPSGHAPGATIAYSFTVTNIGNVTVTGIAIQDAKIAGVTCQATSLAPAASTTCTGSYTLTQADLDAGRVDNTATATGTGVRGGATRSAPASASTPLTASPSLSFSKAAGTPSGNTVGSTITYSFTVRNTGNVTLKGIAIADDKLDAPAVCRATTLAPGASTTCAGRHTLTQADINAGEVVNTARVTAGTDQGTTIGQSDTAIVRIQQNPGLRLVKTAGAPSGSTAGSTISYSFALTNTGNVPLRNVSVAETLPGVVLSGNPVASLAVGESRTITGRYTLKQEDIERGFVVNSATASGRDPGNNPVESAQSSTETRLAQAPKLTLQKTAGVPSSDRAGGTITYSFTVKNEGNVTLSRIAIGDEQLDAPAVCQATTLAPGASTTCTGTHTLTQADINAGKVDNTARVSGQSGSTIVTSDPASASVSIAEKGALTLRKTAGAPSGNTVGSIIRYTFRVTNTGNVPLTLVSIEDAKVGADISGGPWTLQPGEVRDFFADYTLTQADLEAGRVTNTATASGQTPAGRRVTSPPDTVNTTLPAAPKLTLTKTAGTPTGQNAGSTITYTFKVKNEGNVRITGIAIADPRVTGLACDVTALDPNQVATCTGTHSLTQAEVDAGKVDNSATASGKPSRGNALVVSNQASTSTPLARRGAIAVEKTASAPSGNTAGSKIVYAFKVTNTGSVTLTNVRLTEQLAGAVLSGGPIASLAPGAVDTTTFTASYTLIQADIDRGSVENAVIGTGTTPDNKQVNAGGSVKSKVNPAARISLVKRAGTPTGNTVGATIPYSFTVKNEGNVTLRNVTLSDELAGVVVRGGPIATLAPGAVDTTTFTASYTLTQADIDAGKVDNSATTSGQTPAGANVSASSAVSVPLTRDPALTLTKQATAGNPFAAVGDKISYRYVVKNSGNVTITRPITVDDDKIAVVACAALPASGLVPGATLICSATYVVTQADIDAGSVTNRATATDGSARSNEATATVSATARPALAIVKKAGTPSGSSVGSTIDYAFTVTNTGNLTLTNVTVTDALAGVAVKGGPIAELKPGQSDATSFTARYTLTQDDLNRGEVKNSATASGSPPGGGAPITSAPSDVTTKVSTSPSLKIEKRAGAPSGNSVGSTIDYTFAITNTGNVDLKDVSVADALPGIVVTGGPIALLKVGQVDSTTIKARYTLTQKDIDAGKVDNSAIATGSPPGGGAPVTSPASSISTPIDQKAKIDLAKTAQLNDVDRNGIFAPGDTITYSFTVTNTGNVTIDEVLPVDAGPTFNGRPASGKLGPFSPGAVALAPGQKGVFTATYVLTQADIDAGAGVPNGVANIATARGYFRRGGASGGTPVDAPQAKATVDLPAAAPSDIAITKQAGLRMIRRGEKAPWIIKVTNKTDRNVAALNVTDRMPSGFRYVDGTASIDGVAATPVVNGLNVLFRNIKLGPRQEVVIRLQTLALSSATPGRHTNVAVATGPTGNVLAPPASAAIEIMVEPVFDCGDIIGKVFDDKNRNGYQDDGEPGLPGVRVVTVNGVLITTDPYGRFHVACADLPNNRIGSNFIMKLDPRTLPTGYRLTTENPRVIRLTAGKTSKLNFGAALGRVVRLELKDEAFVPGSLALKQAWSEGVDKLIAVLRQEQSTLRIFYLSSNPDLANRRVSAVEGEIGRRWKEAGGPYELSIETRVETDR